MKYKCLIVDDERPALKLLAAYIAKLPNLELVASCENALQALSELQKNKIDLLFLDIQMPELTGLDLLKALKDKPQVILTTAYRDFAVEGFALDVTDYLVKPFALERFVQAVNKAIDQIQLAQKSMSHIAVNHFPNVATTPSEAYFFVRTNHKMEKVKLAEIKYVESMREYVAIFTSNRRFVIHKSMNFMEQELPKNEFIRVHRSYIVNLDFIENIQGNTIEIVGKKIPIGASYRKTFFEKIELI